MRRTFNFTFLNHLHLADDVIVTGTLSEGDLVASLSGVVMNPGIFRAEIVFPERKSTEGEQETDARIAAGPKIAGWFPGLDQMRYRLTLNGDDLPECTGLDEAVLRIGGWLYDHSFWGGSSQDPI